MCVSCFSKINTQVLKHSICIVHNDLYAELQPALWNSANHNSFAICRIKIAIDSANYEHICNILKKILAYDMAHSRTQSSFQNKIWIRRVNLA